jgi:hypothetical protein
MKLFKLQQRGTLSENKDKCTDHSCYTGDETKFPCTNGNCTTPATTSSESVGNNVKLTATERRKSVEKKGKNKTVYVVPRCIYIYIYIYIYVLCNQVPHLKLTAPCLVMNFPVYYSKSQEW